MRLIKMLGMLLVALFLTGTTTASGVEPELIYRVEGKKLEASEKQEVALAARTAFTIKATGPLGKDEVKCSRLKLDSAERPVIVGGRPGTSEKEVMELAECSGSVGGAICSSVNVGGIPVDTELVSVLAPAKNSGQISLLAMIIVVFSINFKSCGVFGNQEAKVGGDDAALFAPAEGEAASKALVWDAGEEITEVKLANGSTAKLGLTSGGHPVTLSGEAEMALAGGQGWGVF